MLPSLSTIVAVTVSERAKKRSRTPNTPAICSMLLFCKRRPRRPRRRPPALSWARALRPDETRGQQMRPSTGRPRRARYEGHHCRRVEWATDGRAGSFVNGGSPTTQARQGKTRQADANAKTQDVRPRPKTGRAHAQRPESEPAPAPEPEPEPEPEPKPEPGRKKEREGHSSSNNNKVRRQKDRQLSKLLLPPRKTRHPSASASENGCRASCVKLAALAASRNPQFGPEGGSVCPFSSWALAKISGRHASLDQISSGVVVVCGSLMWRAASTSRQGVKRTGSQSSHRRKGYILIPSPRNPYPYRGR